ncbi:MAG: hypothetical protein JSS86_12865 [Cyanobacteria bacterium SZAS LIN-2]|nr:hypothetical protein [Cyanobacteria bacterium SZAS LIN-3]MBS1997201.1 hypothetical protein [Cyanobacteria bacterium SZAS LIN-2]MBS2010597.1 hypothetical protein [Cyanobacteria bacterium SZAS TMP-1]
MQTESVEDFVTVETALLKNRVALVSMDSHSMQSARQSLIEMRKIVLNALIDGAEMVSVPSLWFRELEAAYILLF